MSRIATLVRLGRPFSLVLSTLTFFLGVGIARYLGQTIQPTLLLVLLWIYFLQLATVWLTEYFRSSAEPLPDAQKPRERELLRILLLQSAIASLSALAVVTVLMAFLHLVAPHTILLMGMALLLLLAVAIPPVRLIERGFGELAQAIFLAAIVPALALIQISGELTRLLNMLAFPLTLLGLAYFLVLDFPTFSVDVKYQRRTLLFRIGWQRAMFLHHVLLFTAYVLFAALLLFGLPVALIWPAFLTFPLALYQIFMLRNIALGVRPLWNILTLNGAAIFAVTVYLLTMTFWLR